MSLNKDSIFYDILNLTSPWEISIISYTKHDPRIDFKIDYNCPDILCPVCWRTIRIIGKTPVTWKHLDCFQYDTHMTTYLPLVESHNINCKVDANHDLLANTLLLDLIIKQLKNSQTFKPLHFLLKAKGLG